MPAAYTHPPYRCWAAAVLCGAVDACDHIDCHHHHHHDGCRPFLIVFVEARAAAATYRRCTASHDVHVLRERLLITDERMERSGSPHQWQPPLPS